jgi:hypothetical protein
MLTSLLSFLKICQQTGPSVFSKYVSSASVIFYICFEQIFGGDGKQKSMFYIKVFGKIIHNKLQYLLQVRLSLYLDFYFSMVVCFAKLKNEY